MDQYERIRKAATELSAALNQVSKTGATFDVVADRIEITAMGDEFRRYVYIVHVRETSEKEIC